MTAFKGYWVSLWGDENILELDNGDGCTTLLRVLNATELYTAKWLKWDIFYVSFNTYTFFKRKKDEVDIKKSSNVKRPLKTF